MSDKKIFTKENLTMSIHHNIEFSQGLSQAVVEAIWNDEPAIDFQDNEIADIKEELNTYKEDLDIKNGLLTDEMKKNADLKKCLEQFLHYETVPEDEKKIINDLLNHCDDIKGD